MEESRDNPHHDALQQVVDHYRGDYLTIGIGDVFASTLLDAANDDDDDDVGDDDDTSSSEWTGTIKSHPSDFIVREISEHGLVADLALTVDDIPAAISSATTTAAIAATSSSRKKRKADAMSSFMTTTATNESSDIPIVVPMIAARAAEDPPPSSSLSDLRSVLAVVDLSTTDAVLARLSDLHRRAKTTTGTTKGEANDDDDDATTTSSITITSLADRSLRTKLHLALARTFPLLDSRTSDGGRAVTISIDRRFVGLREYLQDPATDLSQLLSLYRHVSNGPSVRLRLRDGLPRADRRPVHRIIAEQSNHMLRTETTTTEDGEDGAGTAGIFIEVKWAERKNTRDRIRTLGVIKKIGCEHTAMMQTLVKKLRCGKDGLSVAGIKDMFAETYQFCVVASASPKPPNAIHVKDIDFIPLGPAPKQLERGELRGNRFELVIRNVRRRDDGGGGDIGGAGHKLREATVLKRFGRAMHFVNYYGEQRVGEPGETAAVGVRAPDIGRAMLQGNYAKAVDLIMIGRKVIQGRRIQVEEFRRVWQESGGDVAATTVIKNIPFKERTILSTLKRFQDPLAALRSIPFHDRIFYINAYQALVWNHAATQRLLLYGCQVTAGDLIIADSSAPRRVTVVKAGGEALFQLSQVVLPLPGSDVVYPQNAIAQVYERTLMDDGVAFTNKDQDKPESSAKGSYRSLISYLHRPVQCHKVEGTDADYRLTFDLSAGSYATMFLRELLRTTGTGTSDALVPVNEA